MDRAESVERLLSFLRRRGLTNGEEIQAGLGISQPVMSRLIKAAEKRIHRIGRARATRYALSREIAGLGAEVPVYRINESGGSSKLCVVHFLADNRHWLEYLDGGGELFSGLPPFVEEMKPQGYIGRNFPALYPELELPTRINDWSDDHHLIALARRGEDCVGNLILGDESLSRFLAHRAPSRTRADYPGQARGALVGPPGSSAGGEHPKFAAHVEGRHVLVKFAAGDGAAANRWRNLLVCEHVALEVLHAAGIPAAKSAWFDIEGDRYLEVERFDRVGKKGRLGMISLAVVNSAYLGYNSDSWTKAVQHILTEPALRITAEDADRLIELDAFGDLIGNTDRHFGNVSFFAEQAEKRTLALTPVYDMLPMAFASVGANIVPATFTPHPPTALNLHVWDDAAKHALEYWDRVQTEEGLSDGFRAICSVCRDAVAKLIDERS